MPIHLRADEGDYAPNVLCPGDPRRATYIAETFFDAGYRLVNEERGMLGYTGTFEGEPISVQTTGMGCPSAGIVFEELAMLGARRLVRVGTCGALQDHMQLGDTVVALSASADDTTALRYAGMPGYSPAATFGLVERAVQISRDEQRVTHVGPIVSSGLFYETDPTAIETWKRLGHLGIEMEAAMMYTVAAVKGLESVAMMAVSDLVFGHDDTERISDDVLRAGVDQMMHIACRVATS